ncbi:unnamed protein product [Caenorhabditis nigoni]
MTYRTKNRRKVHATEKRLKSQIGNVRNSEVFRRSQWHPCSNNQINQIHHIRSPLNMVKHENNANANGPNGNANGVPRAKKPSKHQKKRTAAYKKLQEQTHMKNASFAKMKQYMENQNQNPRQIPNGQHPENAPEPAAAQGAPEGPNMEIVKVELTTD